MVQVFGAAMSTRIPPFLLRADNVTTIERTPWGGTHLADRFKRDVLGPAWAGRPIGESWELSAGNELPSADLDGRLLRDRIQGDPAAMLGREAQLGGNTTALLVKLLDARDDLSVQIHPFDNDPALAPDEAGKAEAWLVVRADEGASIHLGLRDHVDEPLMRQTLRDGGDVSQLLRRWHVAPGDFFVVEPGTPHAIGRGVTLVEPQTATAGKRAMTYRYWDWNRRYDGSGRLDPNGKSRELHVERAIAVTRWPGRDGVEPPFSRNGAADLTAIATWQTLCGPAPHESTSRTSNALRVARLSGTGDLAVPDWNVLRALTVLEGAVDLRSADTLLRVDAGRTAVLPASATDLRVQLRAAQAVVSAVVVP